MVNRGIDAPSVPIVEADLGWPIGLDVTKRNWLAMETDDRYECLNHDCEAEAVCITCLWCPAHCSCVKAMSDCPPWDSWVLPKNKKGGEDE